MFLDTSGLLCLHDRKEPLHQAARTEYNSAHSRFTHSYVLAEFVALAQARHHPRSESLEFIADMLTNPDIDVVWVTEPLNRTAIELLRNRLDKSYSLCDAVSFILMGERSVLEALTTDKHLEQEGFVRLLTGDLIKTRSIVFEDFT